MADREFSRDVVVVGGCGRVGLPLAVAFADRGAQVAIHDIDAAAVDATNKGRMWFDEPGVQPMLSRAVADGRLAASTDPRIVSTAEHVVVVIGTPVDAQMRADRGAVSRAIARSAEHLRDGQLIVLRSTVAVGETAEVEKLIARLGLDIAVAYCPERLAEGQALTELVTLPQIIGARQAEVIERAGRLFERLTVKHVHLMPEEAELAKLFANAWRYVTFAAANEFYMVADGLGLDFARIRQALIADYPRAAGLPGAGLAAGPCLRKDTAQLAEAGPLALGRAAITVNDGLPRYLVERIRACYDLPTTTVGILGMAFKRGSDDTRDSPAYELRRLLTGITRAVHCTDPHVTTDSALEPLSAVIAASDLLIIAAPHEEYRTLRTTKPVVDIWNLLGRGVTVGTADLGGAR